MFDLEKAIAEWRKQMLAVGVKSPVPLEELEGHLREDVEQQVHLGSDEQAAFDYAVRGLGVGGELKREFDKCPSSINNSIETMKQKLINFAAIFALLAIGAGFIMPAIAKWRHVGTLAGMDIVLLLLGTALCTFGVDCGVRFIFKRG